MDLEAKKTALRMLSSGLYLITIKQDKEATASTISWVNQASFDPPLIMMGVRKDSNTNDLLRKAGCCALHFLKQDQKDLAEKFFKSVSLEGNTLGGLEFETQQTGAPIFKQTAAHVECKIINEMAEGDHTVYLAEVVNAEVRENVTSLSMRDTPWHYGG